MKKNRKRELQRRGEREETTEITGGVTIETKEAPRISIENHTQQSNTGSQRQYTSLSLHTYIHIYRLQSGSRLGIIEIIQHFTEYLFHVLSQKSMQ